MADVAETPKEVIEEVSTKVADAGKKAEAVGKDAVEGDEEMAESGEKNGSIEVVDAGKKTAEATEVSKDDTDAGKDTESAVKESSTDDKNHANGGKKSENASESTPSKLEASIIRQVEYYFGDANLARDKFLLGQITKDEEGWVPFSVLLTFKRLSSLSTDIGVIVDSLLKSDEGLLEISDDKQKLRRHPERPIPKHDEERRKEVMSRSAYVKGFPLATQMSDLIDFFSPHEKVLNITMRKYLEKPTKSYKFKGSVFVSFEKKEQAAAFIEKEKIMFEDRELIRKWQKDYVDQKKEELQAKIKKNQAKIAEEEKFVLPKGAVLYFEDATDALNREVLREAIANIEGTWDLAYVDFAMGNKTGHVRFQEENNAVKFLEKLEDNKLKIKDDVSITLRALEGDEEKTYLDNAIEQMKNRRNKFRSGGNRNGKRKGGSYHHNKRNGEKKRKVD